MGTTMTTPTEERPTRATARWRPRLVIGGLLAALLVWAIVAPPAPPAAGTRLVAFQPTTLGRLEQEAWEAYYYRQWPRLFWLMLQVMRTQFGLSWAQAVHGAALNTRAQLVFAQRGDANGEAEALMRAFYALVREPLGATYDADRAAAAEIRWWVVHRRRHEYPDYGELVRAMAGLYSEVYGLPAERVQQAARHRVRAVELSDAWLDAGKPPGSPLLSEVRDELTTGYAALGAAVNAR
jgi:hypothetical protein